MCILDYTPPTVQRGHVVLVATTAYKLPHEVSALKLKEGIIVGGSIEDVLESEGLKYEEPTAFHVMQRGLSLNQGRRTMGIRESSRLFSLQRLF